MAPTTGDLSRFTKMVRGRLSGVTGSYVNDTLSDGDGEVERQQSMT